MAVAVSVLGTAAPCMAGLNATQLADAPAWPGSPVLTTTGAGDLQTDFNVEATIDPNLAAAHTFVPDSAFQLDKLIIRIAGAPTTGELYLFPDPVGGTDDLGYVNVAFSTSLLNGGAGLPFTFDGNPDRRLLEFDLTGSDEIFLSAGTKYAVDIRNTGTGSMYWLRAGTAPFANAYASGSIYVRHNDTIPAGERYDVAGDGRRDGTLALYAPTSVVPVLGDYNNNGSVDAADYVLWRSGGPLQNEVADVGTVSPEDYTEWKARFGNVAGAGSGLSAAAVPEPATWLLLMAAVCLARFVRSRN